MCEKRLSDDRRSFAISEFFALLFPLQLKLLFFSVQVKKANESPSLEHTDAFPQSYYIVGMPGTLLQPSVERGPARAPAAFQGLASPRAPPPCCVFFCLTQGRVHETIKFSLLMARFWPRSVRSEVINWSC